MIKINLYLLTVLLFFSEISTNAMFIPQNKRIARNSNNELTKVLESWNVIKNKLQLRIVDNKKFKKANFDEVEAIKLIPTVIDKLRSEEISTRERQTLYTVYGDLWHIIVEEAHRNNDDNINPLLKSLFDSNEINGNAINNFFISNKALKFELKKRKSIPQRILNTAAKLIEASKTDKYKKIVFRKPIQLTLQILLSNIPSEEIERKKRNTKKINEKDLSSDQIDNLIEVYKAQHDINSHEKIEYDDDDAHLTHNNLHSGDHRDYMYDDLYEDDEDVTARDNFLSKSNSFQDLILLATKHRQNDYERMS